MLDRKDATSIKKELDTYSSSKIELMKASRDVVKSSKILIYSIHRGDMTSAKKNLGDINALRKRIDKLASTPKLKNYSPYENALQEYVEAVAYHIFVLEGRIPTSKELCVDAETYLMGLSDLTGELMRKAVNDAVAEDYEGVKKIRDTVDEIYGLVVGLDLDGGEARRKTDQIKWNLTKVEGIVYDAKIRGNI